MVNQWGPINIISALCYQRAARWLGWINAENLFVKLVFHLLVDRVAQPSKSKIGKILNQNLNTIEVLDTGIQVGCTLPLLNGRFSVTRGDIGDQIWSMTSPGIPSYKFRWLQPWICHFMGGMLCEFIVMSAGHGDCRGLTPWMMWLALDLHRGTFINFILKASNYVFVFHSIKKIFYLVFVFFF